MNVDQEGQATTNGLPCPRQSHRSRRRAHRAQPSPRRRHHCRPHQHARAFHARHYGESVARAHLESVASGRVSRRIVGRRRSCRPRRASAPSITATTLAARYVSRHSPMAWRRSSRTTGPRSCLSIRRQASERGLLAQLTSVQGAIARTVADVRLATRVMAGGDARDPWWVPAPFDGEPLAKPIRVAVTRNSHGYPIHPGIDRLIDRAAGFLSDAGYDVVEAEPPSIMEPARGWFTVLLTELKGTVRSIHRSVRKRRSAPDLRLVLRDRQDFSIWTAIAPASPTELA